MQAVYTLSKLFKQVGRDKRNDLFCSCVAFPRTSSFPKHEPLRRYDWSGEGSIDFKVLIDKANVDTEFIAVGLRTDLMLVLETLSEVKDELLLEKMDCIMIYRCGIDLLMIDNRAKSGCGRSAVVEINDFRRGLQTAPQDKSILVELLNIIGTGIGIVCVVLVGRIIYGSFRK